MRPSLKLIHLAVTAALLTSFWPFYAPPPLIAQVAQDRRAEANRLVQQGAGQFHMQQTDAAFQSWQQALQLYRTMQDGQGEVMVLSQLGLAYEALGNYDKASAYLEQLLAATRQHNNRLGEAFALSRLGEVYLALGAYARAVDSHQQSLAIAQKLNNRGAEGQEFRNLGIAYLALGEPEKAVAAHQRSFAIAQELQDQAWVGIALVDLGTAYNALGEQAKALDVLKQGLAIARQLQDRQGEISALGNLGLVYDALGQYAQAAAAHQQSLALTQTTRDRYAEGISLNNLGLAQFRAGQWLAAEKTLQACLQVLESLRANLGQNDAAKVALFEQQLRSYRTLQQILVAQQKPEAALEISEQGRARAFAELLSARRANPSPAAPQPTPTPLPPPTIAQIQQIAKARNATLVQYSIIYDQFKIGKRQEWKESQLYIWVIAPNGTLTFRTADLKPLWQQQDTTLEALVTTSQQSLGVRSRDSRSDILTTLSPAAQRQQQTQQTRTLRQLYQLLIEPIRDRLPPAPDQPIIFMPQQALFLVPFPALQSPQGKYLVENHTILTAPSIQTLQLTRPQPHPTPSPQNQRDRRAPLSALIVGNPTMPSVSLAPGQPARPLASLPGAATEASAIANLFNTAALIGDQGTKAAVLQHMPQAQVIHFATHGLLDDFRGLGSALALAPSPQAAAPQSSPNGLLTAEEILNLSLQANLVVLSACDTGRGSIRGDGVIGLSRAFLAAGAASVLVSLWAVPDAPTADLMQAFYTNWQTKRLDKAQALRQAMLTQMKTHPNPKDWAAFTLIGEVQ